MLLNFFNFMSIVLQPVLTMNMNVDEMISYACIAWTLAGKVSKTVFILDYSEDMAPDDAAMIMVRNAIDEE